MPRIKPTRKSLKSEDWNNFDINTTLLNDMFFPHGGIFNFVKDRTLFRLSLFLDFVVDHLVFHNEFQ